MKETRHKFSLQQKIHACFMIMALLFLTVSAPLTVRSQVNDNDLSGQQSEIPSSPVEEESNNPFGNNTEEKVPGSNNPLEEFLHDYSDHTLLCSDNINKFGSRDADIFIDYHQELLVPPPNAG
jgi:hypothetical protein